MRSREPSRNTMPTSPGTCTNTRRIAIDTHNGEPHESASGEGTSAGALGPVDIDDVLVIETNEGEKFQFSVVGVVEDEDHERFAICYSEEIDDFVVTDSNGTLLDDDKLAQEILDEFLELADEAGDETESQNGSAEEKPQ